MTNKCAELLANKELTISFIESASAGYLSHRFSLSPYSGVVLVGGLVCYDVKVRTYATTNSGERNCSHR